MTNIKNTIGLAAAFDRCHKCSYKAPDEDYCNRHSARLIAIVECNNHTLDLGLPGEPDPNAPKYSDDEKFVRRHLRLKHTVEEIVAISKYDWTFVNDINVKMGAKTQPAPKDESVYVDRSPEIRALFAEGHKAADIIKISGLSQTYVYKIKKQMKTEGFVFKKAKQSETKSTNPTCKKCDLNSTCQRASLTDNCFIPASKTSLDAPKDKPFNESIEKATPSQLISLTHEEAERVRKAVGGAIVIKGSSGDNNTKESSDHNDFPSVQLLTDDYCRECSSFSLDTGLCYAQPLLKPRKIIHMTLKDCPGKVIDLPKSTSKELESVMKAINGATVIKGASDNTDKEDLIFYGTTEEWAKKFSRSNFEPKGLEIRRIGGNIVVNVVRNLSSNTSDVNEEDRSGQEFLKENDPRFSGGVGPDDDDCPGQVIDLPKSTPEELETAKKLVDGSTAIKGLSSDTDEVSYRTIEDCKGCNDFDPKTECCLDGLAPVVTPTPIIEIKLDGCSGYYVGSGRRPRGVMSYAEEPGTSSPKFVKDALKNKAAALGIHYRPLDESHRSGQEFLKENDPRFSGGVAPDHFKEPPVYVNMNQCGRCLAFDFNTEFCRADDDPNKARKYYEIKLDECPNPNRNMVDDLTEGMSDDDIQSHIDRCRGCQYLAEGITHYCTYYNSSIHVVDKCNHSNDFVSIPGSPISNDEPIQEHNSTVDEWGDSELEIVTQLMSGAKKVIIERDKVRHTIERIDK